jgi:hypothetical protein
MSEIYEAPYPFVRDVYGELDGDESGCGYVEVTTWKPGVRHEYVYPDDTQSVADAVGKVRYTVISRHKPGPRYPERVFYTRKWIDPDGHEFGRCALRITTVQAFESLIRGYRFDYEMAKPKAAEVTV